MDLDKESAEKLRSDLILNSNDEKAKWLEKYVKHGIKSRGVPIPKIRELLIKSVKNPK